METTSNYITFPNRYDHQDTIEGEGSSKLSILKPHTFDYVVCQLFNSFDITEPSQQSSQIATWGSLVLGETDYYLKIVMSIIT